MNKSRVLSVPLISAVFLCTSAFAEEIHVYAGKSWPAVHAQNLGVDYMDKGDFVNARQKFDEAIRLDPTMWPAYYNRADLDLKEHKYREGIADATMALRGKTSFNRSAVLRALISMKLGDYNSARRDLDQMIALGQRGDAYGRALNASAWMRATCPDSRFRNGQLAITEATRALDLSSTHEAEDTDTLAAAYAEIGNFDAAVRAEEKALGLTKSPQEIKEMRRHMTAFKEHRPWREP